MHGLTHGRVCQCIAPPHQVATRIPPRVDVAWDDRGWARSTSDVERRAVNVKHPPLVLHGLPPSNKIEGNMKTWSDSGSVLPTAPRRPHEARIRFLTAGLATLLIILGMESSFPLLKYRIFPWLQSHRTPTESASPKAPIKWDSVSGFRALHSARGLQPALIRSAL